MKMAIILRLVLTEALSLTFSSNWGQKKYPEMGRKGLLLIRKVTLKSVE